MAISFQGQKGLSEADRFWPKVNKTDGCWIWQGAVQSHSVPYGYFQLIGKKFISAHRWSYMHLVGPIPKGMHIDHLCRNPLCVNPKHLEVVTPQENTLRGLNHMADAARRNLCWRGHLLEGANVETIHRKPPRKPHRLCVTCRKARELKYRQREEQQDGEFRGSIGKTEGRTTG